MTSQTETLKHKRNWKCAIPFILLFVYSIILYQFVREIWDDLYLGSLSAWGYTEPGVNGTDFNLYQLLHFAYRIFKVRLTRVVSLVLINSPLLRVQWLYRIIDSICITATIYLVYRYSGAKRTPMVAFSAVFLFGILSQRMYTEGAFLLGGCLIMYGTSALMFAVLYLFQMIGEAQGKKKWFLAFFTAMLAGFTCLMNEIQAVTLCGTMFFIIAYQVIKERKLSKELCFILICAAIGAVIVCFGPGNLNREKNETLAVLSEKIAHNLDCFVAGMFHKSNMPFLLVFLPYVCYLNYEHGRRGGYSKVLPLLPVCLWSLSFIPLTLYLSAGLTINLMNYNMTVNSVVFVVDGLLYFAYAFYLVGLELIRINEIYLTTFSISALLSLVSVFFYAGYIAARMEIMVFLALFCVMLRTFSDAPVSKTAKRIVFSGLAALSCVWMAFFMIGYAKNAPVLASNQQILIEAGQRALAGEEVPSVTLNLNFDKYFTPEFVYPGEPGYPDLPEDVKSLREYYGLNESTEILYEVVE